MSIDLRDIDIQLNGTSIGLIDDKASVFNISTNVTPTSTSLVKNSLSLVVPAIPVGATLMKTGQTTSYKTGDDGDIEAGRATSFTVLASTNPFGNTNRFTDELGGQAYTNNIVIDWSTYNGSNVLGYRRVLYDDNTSWNNAIDLALTKIIGGFSSWRLINRTELNNISNFGSTASTVLNYTPFNITTNLNVWSSTTSPLVTTNAYLLSLLSGDLASTIKTTNGPRYMVTRTFTLTGTTLS